MTLPTDVGIINIDESIQGVDILSHKTANLAKHSPSCLIGDSKFSFKLFCRDTASGRSHQEYGIEPAFQGRRRLVEDSPCRRGYLSAAEVAGIDFPIRNSVVLGNSLTLLTEDTLRPSGILNKFQTSIIIGKLLFKIFSRVFFHNFFLFLFLIPI